MSDTTTTFPLLRLAGLVVLIAVTAFYSAAMGARWAATPAPLSVSAEMPDEVRESGASVVTIYAERPVAALMSYDPEMGGPPDAATRWEWRSAGGVVFAEGGWVLTNHHVVADARHIELRTAVGDHFTARVHASDARRDLAVLYVDGLDLPAVTPAAPDAHVIGDAVWAIGSPFGLEHSVSAGVISGFDRAYDGVDPVAYIQHDAALNPGNSGGGLFDNAGRLVGINTAIAEPAFMDVGVGFAIPATEAFEVAAGLRNHGLEPIGFLGVTVRSLDGLLAAGLNTEAGDGVLVDDVAEGSPAAVAGLIPGDILLHAAGRPLSAPRDLNRILLGTLPGEPLTVVWRRGGVRLETEVTLTSAIPPTRAHRMGIAMVHEPNFGLSFEPQPHEDGSATIREIRPGGPAATAGLRPGDRVLAINGRTMTDGIEAELILAESGVAVALLVERAGDTTQRHVGLSRSDVAHNGQTGGSWSNARGGPY